MMGYAHLGVVLLPKIEDESYEQPQMNFYMGIKKAGNTQNSEHSEVKMLIFGGSKWKDREPNENEHSDRCLLLIIPAGGSSRTY